MDVLILVAVEAGTGVQKYGGRASFPQFLPQDTIQCAVGVADFGLC